jgi:hypothetical protein
MLLDATVGRFDAVGGRVVGVVGDVGGVAVGVVGVVGSGVILTGYRGLLGSFSQTYHLCLQGLR